jgi:hypothetical protein
MASAPSDSLAGRRSPPARAWRSPTVHSRLQRATVRALPQARYVSLANLKANDRTGIEAFLEELRTYLDHHVIL